jgi:uncharacterized Ntn-hydrolase superfamily protein
MFSRWIHLFLTSSVTGAGTDALEWDGSTVGFKFVTAGNLKVNGEILLFFIA